MQTMLAPQPKHVAFFWTGKRETHLLSQASQTPVPKRCTVTVALYARQWSAKPGKQLFRWVQNFKRWGQERNTNHPPLLSVWVNDNHGLCNIQIGWGALCVVRAAFPWGTQLGVNTRPSRASRSRKTRAQTNTPQSGLPNCGKGKGCI